MTRETTTTPEREYVRAAGLPTPATDEHNLMMWGAHDLGWQLCVRFGTEGTVTFDPYWQWGEARRWDHYFAPKRFSYLPQLVDAIRDYVINPTETTAREIHNRRVSS